MIEERNICKTICLSFLTFGIYGIYWFIKITDEINTLTGNTFDTPGISAFAFTIVTLGIYGIYWAYKMGEKIDNYKRDNNSRSMMYALLTIFGLNIIVYSLIQDVINKCVPPKLKF